MAKVKITQKDNGIVLHIDGNGMPYNILEYSIHQEAGKKPTLTFIAPMTLEVDSLEIEGLPAPEAAEPAAKEDAPKFIG